MYRLHEPCLKISPKLYLDCMKVLFVMHTVAQSKNMTEHSTCILYVVTLLLGDGMRLSHYTQRFIPFIHSKLSILQIVLPSLA